MKKDVVEKGGRVAVRTKRAALRKGAAAKQAAVRRKVRNAAMVVALCWAVAGCNTATPASKSASSEASRNVTTVNNSFGFLAWPATNGVAVASGFFALPVGGVTVNVSDLNGTIAQSADTEGGDQTDLSANPSMAAGITGDAPLKALTEAVAAFASPQSAADSVLDALTKRFGVGPATNAVASAVSAACVEGHCSP